MKRVDFSETIAASDLKVGRSRHLIEFMKVCEYWPKVKYIQKFKPDFLRNYCAVLNLILYQSFQVQGNENLIHDVGHMTKMATAPIYGKNPSQIFISGTGGPISTKIGM